MKGFQEKTQGDGNFFVIKHYTICRESKTPQDGFKEIEVENPETHQKIKKYIKEYDTIEALITRIEWYDTAQQYNRRFRGFKLHLAEGDRRGVLDLPISARVTSRFLKLAENLDFSQPVEFRAWKDRKKDTTALLVAQNGKTVEQKYTADKPLDMPPPSQSASTGKWNYDGQTDFLHKKMMEVVIPRVAAAHPDKQKAENAETQSETAPSNGSPDAKLLERVKEALTDLSEHDDYQDRSRAQLLDEFFGCSKFSEVESMNPESIKLALKEIDKVVVPF